MALSFTAGPIMAIQLEFVRKTVIVFQLIIISIFLNAQSNCAFDTHWVPYKLRNGNFVYVDSATMQPIIIRNALDEVSTNISVDKLIPLIIYLI